MKRLSHASEIIDLANDLGLTDGADPFDSILGHCRQRIDAWVAEAGGVKDIAALESLVTRKLHLIFEEVRSDDDFGRITDKYARVKKDPVFATMRFRFDDVENPTFGALVKRKCLEDDAPDRFVAVIDCRGSKLARRFFTRWHEIAHRLTTHADQGATEPAFRSDHDPIERLMDEIAGQIGFYGPIFDPVFAKAKRGRTLLTFEAVQNVVDGGFSEASFQATLTACTRRLPTPVIYLEAALAHKKEVKRLLAMPSLFGDDPPLGELRAVKVIQNKAAQAERFTIPTNMRVPAASVIRRLFDAEQLTDEDGEENLSQWETQGRRLQGRPVVVEGRKVADRVIAIVQPVEPVRGKREERAELFSEQQPLR